MIEAISRKNTVDSPKLIAHRGFAVGAPQNSIPAFVEAGERGFWAIETDVHKTKDGVLVCNHDPVIDTMFNGSGHIADMTYHALSARHFKDSVGCYPADELVMPTFDDYLAICKKYGAIPFIETKTFDIEAVLGKATEYFAEDEIIISSIVLEHLLHTREVSNKVFVHHIFSTPDIMHRLSADGNCGVSYNYPNLDSFPQALLDDVHRSGAMLCLRAGDTAETATDMINMGLDYIPTNCVTNEDVRSATRRHR